MTPTFSLCISHTPWIADRVKALDEMLYEINVWQHDDDCAGSPIDDGYCRGYDAPLDAILINDHDYRGTDWQVSKVEWALRQWRWSVAQPTTHHVFMTDDLHIAPSFWPILTAMVQAHPDVPIGLLSNHPRGPGLFAQNRHGYRTNSWLVGPAYVMPHKCLVDFLAWFEALSFPDQQYANDDSSINAWNTLHGGPGETWHPLPTIIEHRADIGSTVGHGDRYSAQRLSWRGIWDPLIDPTDGEALTWHLTDLETEIDPMTHVDFWSGDAPMLAVGE